MRNTIGGYYILGRTALLSYGELVGFGQPLKYTIVPTKEEGPSLAALKALGNKETAIDEKTGESSPSLF